MNTKEALDRYLGKNTRITETDKGNGYKEVCVVPVGAGFKLTGFKII